MVWIFSRAVHWIFMVIGIILGSMNDAKRYYWQTQENLSYWYVTCMTNCMNITSALACQNIATYCRLLGYRLHGKLYSWSQHNFISSLQGNPIFSATWQTVWTYNFISSLWEHPFLFGCCFTCQVRTVWNKSWGLGDGGRWPYHFCVGTVVSLHGLLLYISNNSISTESQGD